MRSKSLTLVNWALLQEKQYLKMVLPEDYAGFQNVKESNSNILFELDLMGTIEYISPEINAILGYDPQMIIGKNFCNCIILSDLPNADRAIESVISDAKIEQLKVRVKSKDRNIMTLKVKLLPKVAKQKVAGVQGVCHTEPEW